MVAGFRQVIRYFCATHPDYRAWMQGYSVMAMVYLMQRRDMPYFHILGRLVRHCPDFLPNAQKYRRQNRALAQSVPRESPPEHLVVS